jgi:molecular chaperone GrpE
VDQKPQPTRSASDDDDDVEILEVVGFEDTPDRVDGWGDAGRGAPPAENADEILVRLDTGLARRRSTDPPLNETERAAREQVLRLSADFENYRRRIEREREDSVRHASAGLVTRLLPVLDNFERALSHDPGPGADRFYDGVVLIFRQLLEELRREGLTAVDSVGEPFDPAHHEAVSTTVEQALPANIVVEEMQRGYRLYDRLLRPALVKVTVEPAEDPGGSSAR